MNTTTSTTRDDIERRDRELFDKIAAAYCRKDSARSSSIARQHRLMQTLKAVPEGESGNLLEVGCGAGYAARYLAGRFESYTGVDYSAELIRLADQENAGPNVEFITANVKEFKPSKYPDIIFAIGVLHHLDDLEEAVVGIVNMLRPGGWLVANEPSPANPLVNLARKARKKIDSAYSDEQVELSEQQLRTVFRNAGLESINVAPQGILSTPFAEVILPPQWLTAPISRLACALDAGFERTLCGIAKRLSWNVIVAGQKPMNSSGQAQQGVGETSADETVE